MAWLPKKIVVVPVDFSTHSADAIRVALKVVARPEHVHAIYVLLPMENLSPGMAWGTVDDESRKNSLQHHFELYRSEHGFDGITTAVRVGDPGLEISDYANELQADLVVMPSHGYRGLKRLVLGSVAERVLRHAGCPVLVLKRAESDKDTAAT